MTSDFPEVQKSVSPQFEKASQHTPSQMNKNKSTIRIITVKLRDRKETVSLKKRRGRETDIAIYPLISGNMAEISRKSPMYLREKN